MHYPQIDPIILSLGPVALRWYGLMYLLGFAAVWWLGSRRAASQSPHWSDNELSDMVFYGAMGAVLGGRIGYVFFYNFPVFANDPLYLLRIWEGGMAFHGGFLGVLVAMTLFARKTGRSFISITDFLAPLCPIGFGLVRIGNFINGELPGRVSDSGFGLIYPCEVVMAINPLCVGAWESAVRHPSPLYQAFFEGAVLFTLLWLVSRKPRPAGLVSAAFLCGYGSFRLFTELFREPDAHIGFVLLGGVSMGQLLSLPLLIAGILLGFWALQNARKSAH